MPTAPVLRRHSLFSQMGNCSTRLVARFPWGHREGENVHATPSGRCSSSLRRRAPYADAASEAVGGQRIREVDVEVVPPGGTTSIQTNTRKLGKRRASPQM